MAHRKRLKKKKIVPDKWTLDLRSLDFTDLNNIRISTEESIFILSHFKWKGTKLHCVLDAVYKMFTIDNVQEYPEHRFFYETDVIFKGSISDDYKLLKNIIVPNKRVVLAQQNEKQTKLISFTSSKIKSLTLRSRLWEYTLK